MRQVDSSLDRRWPAYSFNFSVHAKGSNHVGVSTVSITGPKEEPGLPACP